MMNTFLDKHLVVALLISTVFHTLIFIPLPQFKNHHIRNTPPELKITYLVSKITPAKNNQAKVETKPKVVSAQVAIKEVPAQFKKLEPKQESQVQPQEKPFQQEVIAAKAESTHHKIEIPKELPKEKEAVYLDYYQSIREKIRGFVLHNYPRYIACGEVCLYFILLPEGKLKEIKIVEERSSQNHLLKEIAKRSVQEASPFLPFPKDLTQSKLSFNVIISFELEKN